VVRRFGLVSRTNCASCTSAPIYGSEKAWNALDRNDAERIGFAHKVRFAPIEVRRLRGGTIWDSGGAR